MHSPIGYWGGAGWGWGLLGLIVPLLFWGGLIAGLIALSRSGDRRGSDTPLAPPPHQAALPRPDDPALSILRERYARGEIDSADYEERRRLLREEHPGL